MSLLIMVPVFNDWASLAALLPQIDQALSSRSMRARVLVVDDGSPEPAPAAWIDQPLSALDSVSVLTLRRNLGHQRAIAVGLAYIQDKEPCDAVLVMDGDGEDAPADVPRLIEAFDAAGKNKIVFAGRHKRSESFLFRTCYQLFKLVHRVLTGHRVQVGNFSVLPRTLLDRLVVISELWNHYPAAVYKARLPFTILPTQRGQRLAGQSRMNFVSLVIHGLSAISVFGDIVGVRLLVAMAGLIALTLAGIVTAVVLRLASNLAIPGWATYTTGILLIIMLQAVMMSLVFIFIVLSARQGTSFLPIRDYHHYCHNVQPVWGKEPAKSEIRNSKFE